MRTAYRLNMLVKRLSSTHKIFFYTYEIGWIKSISALAFPIYKGMYSCKECSKQAQRACRQMKEYDKLYTTQHEKRRYL
jgi:hypothetical protein